MLRRVLVVAGLFLAVVSESHAIGRAQLAQAGNAKRFAESVTIYRDRFGIPHIFGPTDASVVFGFGYAQAEDFFPRLEENFILAIGRSAEIIGEDQIESDRLNRAPVSADGEVFDLQTLQVRRHLFRFRQVLAQRLTAVAVFQPFPQCLRRGNQSHDSERRVGPGLS